MAPDPTRQGIPQHPGQRRGDHRGRPGDRSAPGPAAAPRLGELEETKHMVEVTIPADLPTVQQIPDGDAGKPAPAPFREQSPKSFPLSSVPVEHYTSKEFLELEYTHLWSKVWQWAANEEDVPNVGDYVVYDIGDH